MHNISIEKSSINGSSSISSIIMLLVSDVSNNLWLFRLHSENKIVHSNNIIERSNRKNLSI